MVDDPISIKAHRINRKIAQSDNLGFTACAAAMKEDAIFKITIIAFNITRAFIKRIGVKRRFKQFILVCLLIN